MREKKKTRLMPIDNSSYKTDGKGALKTEDKLSLSPIITSLCSKL